MNILDIFSWLPEKEISLQTIYEEKNKSFKIPEIYCAISIVLHPNTDIDGLLKKLNNMGIHDIEVTLPKRESIIRLDIAIIRNKEYWCLDDALSEMFLHVENCLVQLKKLIDDLGGVFCIDIAFYQYGTYPALEFMGENMKKIRFLEAEISIDAY